MVISTDAKNSAISFDKGAPPETKNLIFPPNFSFTLLYINLSAILCLNDKPKLIDFLSRVNSEYFFPIESAQ